MHCSLGVFDLDPSYLAVIQALAGLRRELETSSDPAALKRRIRDIGDVERRAARDVPDLLHVADGDSPWIESIYEVLVELSAQRLLTLESCVFEPERKGYVAFVVQCPEHHHVVRGAEEVVAGVAALRDRGGQLSIWPRVSRVENGLGMLFVPEREGFPVQTPADAVRWCLSDEAVALAFDQARRAAEQMLIDPKRFLQSLGEPSLEADLLARYEEAGDRTYWGLVGAVSSLALDADSLRSRLKLEAMAGRLAVALCGPAPVAQATRTVFAKRRPTGLTGTFGDVD